MLPGLRRISPSRQRPVDGWILDKIVACDEAFPGTLRRYITASPLRAQVIALALNELNLERPDLLAARLRPLNNTPDLAFTDPLALIAYTILHRRVRDIVRSLYPEAQGLTGVLGKIGGEPLSEENYRLIVELHRQPQHRMRLSPLRHMRRIPPRIFAILMALEPPYLSVKLVECFASVHQVKDFQRSVELIKRVVPEVSDEVLATSLEDMAGGNLGEWVRGWLDRASYLWIDPPSLCDSDFVVIADAASMRETGRRFSNCLETKVALVALGRRLFLEYIPDPCLVELEKLDQGWAFRAVHGRSNFPVDPVITRAVIKKLSAAGVRIPGRLSDGSHFNRVAQLIGVFDFDQDDFGLLDEAEELADKLAFDVARAA